MRFGRRNSPLVERFQFYVMPEPNTGCWFWMARINQKGYGIMGIGSKKVRAPQIIL